VWATRIPRRARGRRTSGALAPSVRRPVCEAHSHVDDRAQDDEPEDHHEGHPSPVQSVHHVHAHPLSMRRQDRSAAGVRHPRQAAYRLRVTTHSFSAQAPPVNPAEALTLGAARISSYPARTTGENGYPDATRRGRCEAWVTPFLLANKILKIVGRHARSTRSRSARSSNEETRACSTSARSSSAAGTALRRVRFRSRWRVTFSSPRVRARSTFASTPYGRKRRCATARRRLRAASSLGGGLGCQSRTSTDSDARTGTAHGVHGSHAEAR
jgi:hypothetical protein